MPTTGISLSVTGSRTGVPRVHRRTAGKLDSSIHTSASYFDRLRRRFHCGVLIRASCLIHSRTARRRQKSNREHCRSKERPTGPHYRAHRFSVSWLIFVISNLLQGPYQEAAPSEKNRKSGGRQSASALFLNPPLLSDALEAGSFRKCASRFVIPTSAVTFWQCPKPPLWKLRPFVDVLGFNACK